MIKAVNPMSRKKAGKKGDSVVRPVDAEAIIREMAASLREHADFLDGCIDVYEKIERPPVKVLTGKFFMRLRQIRETFNIQILAKMQKSKKGAFESHHAVFGNLINRLGDLADRMDAIRQRHANRQK